MIGFDSKYDLKRLLKPIRGEGIQKKSKKTKGPRVDVTVKYERKIMYEEG